jgi:hypothetical protein
MPFKRDAIQTPRQFATLVSLELRQLLTRGHSRPRGARPSPKKHGAGLKPHSFQISSRIGVLGKQAKPPLSRKQAQLCLDRSQRGQEPVLARSYGRTYERSLPSSLRPGNPCQGGVAPDDLCWFRARFYEVNFKGLFFVHSALGTLKTHHERLDQSRLGAEITRGTLRSPRDPASRQKQPAASLRYSCLHSRPDLVESEPALSLETSGAPLQLTPRKITGEQVVVHTQ